MHVDTGYVCMFVLRRYWYLDKISVRAVQTPRCYGTDIKLENVGKD